MNDDRMMMVLGAGLSLLAAASVAVHLRSWRAARSEAGKDEFEQKFARRRFSRRVQTSALMVILGLFVALHPIMIPDPKEAPRLFGVWWMSALAVASWIILMAAADLVSTRAHSRVTLSRLHLKQRQLHQQLEEFQRRRERDE